MLISKRETIHDRTILTWIICWTSIAHKLYLSMVYNLLIQKQNEASSKTESKSL